MGFRIIYFFLVIIIIGCDNRSKRVRSTELDFAKNYIQGEIGILENANLTLTKNLDYKERVETIIEKNPNWKKELIPFTETLLNESTGFHSYQKDSITNGDLKIISLKSTDAASTIKSLQLYSTKNINDSLIMILQVSNSYYKSADTLSYYGNGNFRIKTENLPGIGKKLGFILEGKTTLN